MDSPDLIALARQLIAGDISADEFRRLKGNLTGQALIAAMQASPHREIDIEPERMAMPVRKVVL